MAAFDPANCTDDTLGCSNTLTTEQLFHFLFTTDANGCLALRVSGVSGGGGAGDASAANQITGNNSLASILARLNAILPSGTETPSATIVGIGAGTVTAGKLSVTFTTDGSFVGTILGVSRNASTTYRIPITSPGKTLAAIAYNVTAGSMTIDTTT